MEERKVWAVEDIQAGLILIRNSSKSMNPQVDLSFKRTVTVKVGFSFIGRDQSYNLISVLTDGFTTHHGSKAELVKILNEDLYGYRYCTQEEFIAMITSSTVNRFEPNSIKKTHQVLDLTYHEDEGQGCFDGTEKECHDFIDHQGDIISMYKVVPLTKEEIDSHPDNQIK